MWLFRYYLRMVPWRSCSRHRLHSWSVSWKCLSVTYLSFELFTEWVSYWIRGFDHSSGRTAISTMRVPHEDSSRIFRRLHEGCYRILLMEFSLLWTVIWCFQLPRQCWNSIWLSRLMRLLYNCLAWLLLIFSPVTYEAAFFWPGRWSINYNYIFPYFRVDFD